MRSIRSLAVVPVALALSGAVALAFLTDTSGQVPPHYDTFLPPVRGGSYSDPVYELSIKRLTNAPQTPDASGSGMLEFITTEYSTMTPFSQDSSYLILQHQGYFGLYDGQGSFIRNLPFEISAAAEPRWSRQSEGLLYYRVGNRLKSYDVRSQVTTLVHSFSEYTSISGKGESDICFDGNHLVLAGDTRYIFVYEISTDTKGPVFDAGDRGYDSLYITPDDNVTISWLQPGTARYNGIELFDRSLVFQRQLARAGGHMDVTRDSDGSEVMAWANAADPRPICNNGIVKVRLATGAATCLVQFDWSLAVHVSAPDQGGWVFVETYALSNPDPSQGGSWPAYTNELLQVKLDGSRVRRLAQHRSRPFDTYYYTPRLATNRPGTKLVFSSNYGLTARMGYATPYTDSYMIDVPGVPPRPSPAPSPTPIPAP